MEVSEEQDGRTKWYLVDGRLLPVKAFYFFCLGAVGDLLPYISLFMKQIGLTSEITGIIYGVMPFIGFLARPITGLFADKFQKHKLFLVVSCILTGIFFALMIFIPYDKTLYSEVKTTLKCNKFGSYTDDCIRNTHPHCPMSLAEYIDNAFPHSLELQNASDYSVFSERLTNDDNLSCSLNCAVKKLKNATERGGICFTNSGKEYEEKNCLARINSHSFSFSIRNVSNVVSHIVFDQTQTFKNEKCFVFGLKSLHYRDTNYWELMCENEEEVNCDLECSMLKTQNCLKQHTVTKTRPLTLWLFVIFFFFGNIFFSPIISLGDAMAYDILGEKRGLWGRQRLWGTVGFALFAVSSTFIMDYVSKNPLLIDYTISFVIFLVLFLITAVVSFKIDASENIKCSNMFKGVRSLFSYPAVIVFLSMQLLFGALQGVIETFLYWFLKDELNNHLQIIPGLCLLVSCSIEVPMLFYSGLVISKIGHLNCLYLAFFAYGFRFLFYSLLTNAWFVLPIELLHAFTFGLMWSAATSYASIIAPEGMSATVQGLLGGLNFGCGKGIGSLVTGILYDASVLGPVWTFRFYSALSVAAAVTFILINKVCINYHPYEVHGDIELRNKPEVGTDQKEPLNQTCEEGTDKGDNPASQTLL